MGNGRNTRRHFLRTASAAAGAAFVLPGFGLGCRPSQSRIGKGDAQGWDLVPEILARIVPPTFPDRDFLITDYGASVGGTGLATDAIRAAIEDAHRSGGGRVVVPPGRFETGAVVLKSDVNLHISEGATLAFSTDPDDYPVVFTRWEGVELMNYSPLIYAFEEENVAVTGTGTLDGQAAEDNWWPWKGAWKHRRDWADLPNQREARNRLFRMGEENVPVEDRVFGDADYLRPQFIQPYRCENVLIEGVTILRSPMWEVHPVLCNNVTVRDLHIDTHGPNNDGCNPESCRDVLIDGCYFDTGDDCIAIKAGRNAEGRRLGVPSENIVVRNCHMKDGHGGVVMGSEMSGGVRNVFAEDCLMDSPNLERVLRLKTNSVRGGFIENVYMRNIAVGQVADAIFRVNFFYEEGDAGDHPPRVENVEMRNVTSRRSRYGLFMRGFDHTPIRNIRVIDCRFDDVQDGNVIEHVEDVSFENVYINGRLVPSVETAEKIE